MQYRRFGKLEWEPSALGFGAMRLPILDNQQAKIDEPEAIAMIRRCIDSGVNYVDTAYPYHDGSSEPCVGRALKDGYREKVRLATKQPTWFINQAADFDRYLKEQLERLQTDRIDFYLLHGMNRDNWSKVRDLGVLKWAEGVMADGRIGHLGFSFHDDFDVFRQIVDDYDHWTFCQIQYNYMDVDYQAGTKGLRYAAEKGLAVVIMEPLRGGNLTKEPPKGIARILADAPAKRSQADWALQWLWNDPDVSLVLSGMTTMQHVEENLASANRSGVGNLTPEELETLERVREAYKALNPIPCTSCQYCMPCPNGVNIPGIFSVYNDAVIYDDARKGRFLYRGPTGLKESERAHNCVECGECEEKCPQEIPVAKWLKKVEDLLGPKKKA